MIYVCILVNHIAHIVRARTFELLGKCLLFTVPRSPRLPVLIVNSNSTRLVPDLPSHSSRTPKSPSPRLHNSTTQQVNKSPRTQSPAQQIPWPTTPQLNNSATPQLPKSQIHDSRIPEFNNSTKSPSPQVPNSTTHKSAIQWIMGFCFACCSTLVTFI